MELRKDVMISGLIGRTVMVGMFVALRPREATRIIQARPTAFHVEKESA